MLGYVTSNAVTDGNVRVYSKEPFTPYSIGDLWIDGTGVKTCDNERLTGSYSSGDWGGTVEEKVSLAPNVSSMTTTPETLSQKGVVITNDAMGFSDGSAFVTYIKADGSFKFSGDINNYIEWNGSTLVLKGSMTIQNPSTAGITADDINAVDIDDAGDLAYLDLVGTAKLDTTVIVGGYLKTSLVEAGSITADKIDANSISTGQLSASLSISTTGSGYFTGNVHGAYITASNGLTASRADSTAAVSGSNTGSGNAGSFSSNNTSSTVYSQNSSSGNGIKGVSVSGTGVYGKTNASNHVGVFGEGDYAIVADDAGSFGFWTAGACWFEGAAYPFTGAHITLTKEQPEEGDIIIATDAMQLTINNSIAYATTSTIAKDKRVFGICNKDNQDLYNTAVMSGTLGDKTFDEDGNITKRFIKEEYAEEVQNLINEDYSIGSVNAIGEGAISVCSEGGDIEVGDYICSSSIKGKGMKQPELEMSNGVFLVGSDGILMNYTVAKALEIVTWDNEPSNVKMIACTYHGG